MTISGCGGKRVSIPALKLDEIPFFGQLPEDVSIKVEPFINKILLNRVEVLPRDRRWILHLSLVMPVGACAP
jgi:DNA polymerase-3 subunit alpha (Gram-positive type)